MINSSLLRLIFVLPTLLYVASIASRVIIERGKQKTGQEDEDSDTGDKNFEFSLFADSLVLSLLNGFIVLFGLGQTIFGIGITAAGVIISMFGISALLTESGIITEVLLIIANVILFGEFIDFLTYSYIASAGLIVALIAILFYYMIRVSRAAESSSS